MNSSSDNIPIALDDPYPSLDHPLEETGTSSDKNDSVKEQSLEDLDSPVVTEPSNQSVDFLTQSLADMTERCRIMEERAHIAESRCAQLELSLHKHAITSNALESEVEKLSAAIRGELDKMIADSEEAANRIASLDSALAERDEKIASLMRQLADASQLVEETKDIYENRIKQTVDDYSSRNSQSVERERVVEETKKNLDDVIQEAQQKQRQAESAAATAKLEADATTTLNQSLERRVMVLETELAKLRTELKEEMARNFDLSLTLKSVDASKLSLATESVNNSKTIQYDTLDVGNLAENIPQARTNDSVFLTDESSRKETQESLIFCDSVNQSDRLNTSGVSRTIEEEDGTHVISKSMDVSVIDKGSIDRSVALASIPPVSVEAIVLPLSSCELYPPPTPTELDRKGASRMCMLVRSHSTPSSTILDFEDDNTSYRALIDPSTPYSAHLSSLCESTCNGKRNVIFSLTAPSLGMRSVLDMVMEAGSRLFSCIAAMKGWGIEHSLSISVVEVGPKTSLNPGGSCCKGVCEHEVMLDILGANGREKTFRMPSLLDSSHFSSTSNLNEEQVISDGVEFAGRGGDTLVEAAQAGLSHAISVQVSSEAELRLVLERAMLFRDQLLSLYPREVAPSAAGLLAVLRSQTLFRFSVKTFDDSAVGTLDVLSVCSVPNVAKTVLQAEGHLSTRPQSIPVRIENRKVSTDINLKGYKGINSGLYTSELRSAFERHLKSSTICSSRSLAATSLVLQELQRCKSLTSHLDPSRALDSQLRMRALAASSLGLAAVADALASLGCRAHVRLSMPHALSYACDADSFGFIKALVNASIINSVEPGLNTLELASDTTSVTITDAKAPTSTSFHEFYRGSTESAVDGDMIASGVSNVSRSTSATKGSLSRGRREPLSASISSSSVLDALLNASSSATNVGFERELVNDPLLNLTTPLSVIAASRVAQVAAQLSISPDRNLIWQAAQNTHQNVRPILKHSQSKNSRGTGEAEFGRETVFSPSILPFFTGRDAQIPVESLAGSLSAPGNDGHNSSTRNSSFIAHDQMNTSWNSGNASSTYRPRRRHEGGVMSSTESSRARSTGSQRRNSVSTPSNLSQTVQSTATSTKGLNSSKSGSITPKSGVKSSKPVEESARARAIQYAAASARILSGRNVPSRTTSTATTGKPAVVSIVREHDPKVQQLQKDISSLDDAIQNELQSVNQLSQSAWSSDLNNISVINRSVAANDVLNDSSITANTSEAAEHAGPVDIMREILDAAHALRTPAAPKNSPFSAEHFSELRQLFLSSGSLRRATLNATNGSPKGGSIDSVDGSVDSYGFAAALVQWIPGISDQTISDWLYGLGLIDQTSIDGLDFVLALEMIEQNRR